MTIINQKQCANCRYQTINVNLERKKDWLISESQNFKS